MVVPSSGHSARLGEMAASPDREHRRASFRDAVRVYAPEGLQRGPVGDYVRTSASLAQVVDPSEDREGGYGLRLVDALADSWGVEPGAPGRVWCTMSGPSR